MVEERGGGGRGVVSFPQFYISPGWVRIRLHTLFSFLGCLLVPFFGEVVILIVIVIVIVIVTG